MKKAKIKKRKDFYLVYTDKKEMFKCPNIETALLYFKALKGI